MGGIGSGVEVEQLAENGAGAGAGVCGQGQGVGLGEQGAVGVVGDQQGGLFGGRDLRGPGWARSPGRRSGAGGRARASARGPRP